MSRLRTAAATPLGLALWLVVWLAAAVSPAGAAETTFEREVRDGDRLEVRNYKGSVRIVGWDRMQLRVEADHRNDEEVLLERRGAKWLLVPEAWRRDSDDFELRLPDMARVRVVGAEPPSVDLVVSMPAGMGLVVESPHGDVTVEGVRGSLDVTSMLGDITVDGAGASMRLRSMVGQIEVRGASGRTTIEAATGRVEVRASAGELRVETTTGDVLLEELETVDVEVTSLGGNIGFQGVLPSGGRYDLSTHSGDVELALEDAPNAQFSVRAFRGSIVSDLSTEPLSEEGRAEFTVGDGSARVRLESFSGRIRVGKAGASQEP